MKRSRAMRVDESFFDPGKQEFRGLWGRVAGLLAVSVLCSALIGAPTNARAQGAAETLNVDRTSEIFEPGLDAAVNTLRAISEPNDADRALLGAALFLQGIEGVLQACWRMGIDGGIEGVPVFQLDLRGNLEPDPIIGAEIAKSFKDLISAMAASRAALEDIPNDSAIAVEIDLDRLWFDINQDGARGGNEGVGRVITDAIVGRNRDNFVIRPVTVRFDVADAVWLSGYTHALDGLSELILAFDPATVVDGVLADDQALRDVYRDEDGDGPQLRTHEEREIGLANAIMVLFDLLAQQPDPARVQAAHAHFVASADLALSSMELILEETDDDREWIPSHKQTMTLPLEAHPITLVTWGGYQEHVRGVLDGSILIPHRALPFEWGGVNLRRWFEAPVPIDVLGFAHGRGLIDFIEEGEQFATGRWGTFDQLTGDDTLKFVFLLR